MTPSQRNSTLCPNCRKLISKDEPRCPYCGISNPGSWWKNNRWTQGFRTPDQWIKTIMYTNIGMYLLSIFFNPWSAELSLNPLTTLSPGTRSLLLLGATGVIPIDQMHRWWTLISANYLHGSILHILFNMVALWQISHLVCQEYGVYRMFCIYTLSGIFGYTISYLAGVGLTIGASAAVCGMIGAALYFGKSRGGTYGQAVYKQIGGWAISIFIFGFLIPGINNWGHGGGLAAGVLLGMLLGYEEKRKENLFHKLLAAVLVIATILTLGWAIATGLYFRLPG